MLHGFDSIILGIIEGLTEFLPVSSTGHMILTNKLLGYEEAPETLKTFEIVIQFAAILAIAIVYRRKVIQVLGFRGTEKAQGLRVDSFPKRRLNLLHVLLGIVPPLAAAFLFRDFIKTLGFTPTPVLWALVVGGIYMWVSELLYDGGRIRRTSETMDDITYKQALLIGLIQCVSALWPGFSRSGSTMAAGLLTGLSYRASADFSFFIAIPIMTAATGYELLGNIGNFRPEDIGFFATGFVVSFLVALLVVVVFLRWLQRIKLRYFAWYRFALAALFWLFVMR
ncbi:undecaprenyl-diphosphate phosphatase [Cohnella nanjingensis]|uniref:Undecaprenyl-diphosphatase n=1 Tax=Cohnella nanjingensis TaxID=1387779 RepID=A0A7X0RRW5_9BACL|nr:undecaprenyl-diphosphate phosphatase [Cohnella nanjingensis]MBB6672343.1 undecaprenyl-diphosphate phosphatase [Cohnella nanjingensis]